ncbi:MAG: hypothetical protein QOC92_2383 [Acidimicrobiaceae bacterium]|jgi:hypothetical protein
MLPPVAFRHDEPMHSSISDMPIEMQAGEIETRASECDGVLARHIQLPAGVDFTPLFKGLPGDLCQCPHWGQVLEGSIRVRYADGTEELNSAGDVYYWRGGHTGWTDEGVTFLEFSPTAEIQPVLEHLAAQMAAAE